MKPFIDKEDVRLFDSNVNPDELQWHFDNENRTVYVIESNGWKFQFDNQLPIELFKNSTIQIPKGMYHRILKGNGNLIVRIKKEI